MPARCGFCSLQKHNNWLGNVPPHVLYVAAMLVLQISVINIPCQQTWNHCNIQIHQIRHFLSLLLMKALTLGSLTDGKDMLHQQILGVTKAIFHIWQVLKAARQWN
jgi:hypothetical protein